MTPPGIRADRGRGATPLLALVLMIGVVVAGSLTVILVGGEVLTVSQQDAEDQRIEDAFVGFGKSIDTVALSTDSSRSVDLDVSQATGAVRKENAGRITVTVSDGTEIANQTIGAIEYENDGTVVAYQAGGVWRGTGADSRMVSAPPINYRDGTLNLPVTILTGEEQYLYDRVSIQKESTTAETDYTVVEGRVVTLTVTSEYYAGWADFFETRTEAGSVVVDHATQTVTVRLGRPYIDGDFSQAILAAGSIQATETNACIEANISATGSIIEGACGTGERVENVSTTFYPLDEAINMTVEATRNGTQANIGSGGVTLTNGTYFAGNDVVITKDVTIDLAGGDVALVVDGHLALDNARIRVVNGDVSDSSVRIYTTGDIAIGSGRGGVVIEADESKRFQLYGTSQMHFGLGQGEFTGTIYAPRNEPADGDNEAANLYVSSANNCHDIDGEPPDVCIGRGNVDFTGSIVMGSMVVDRKSTIRHDSALLYANPEFALDEVVMPPPLTYLHVSVHEVEVSLE